MGADVVIAVDLNGDLISGRQLDLKAREEKAAPGGLVGWLSRLPGLRRSDSQSMSLRVPSVVDVLGVSLNIMQTHITRSRLAGEPADLTIRPRLARLALMDFHRGELAIAEGERVAGDALRELQGLMDACGVELPKKPPGPLALRD